MAANKIILFLLFTSLSSYSAEEGPSLEERIENLEIEKELDIFQFGSTFVHRYDKTKIRQIGNDHENLSYHRLRYSLNANARPYSNLTLFSRISMGKFFNVFYSQNENPNPLGFDLRRSEGLDGKVVVERAYIDYFFPKFPELVLSVGRLPTIGGPPSHVPDSRDQQGTYPQLAYSVELDGMAVTYKVDRFLPDSMNLSARFVYKPIHFLNFAYGRRPTNQPYYPGFGDGKTSVNGHAGLLDYKYHPNRTLLRSLHYIFQFSKLNDVFNSNGDVLSLENNTTVTSTVSSNDLRGKVKFLTHYLALEDLFISGLSFHYSITWSELRSIGSIRFTGINQDYGYNTFEKDVTHKGYLYLAGFNYEIPFLFRPKIGFDFHYSGPDSYFYDASSQNLGLRFEQKGRSYHFYCLIPIEDTFTLRLGYLEQKSHRGFIGFGDPAEFKRTSQTLYTNLRLDI